ncbi:MAG: TetR/AcrR family transcriptional regulator [Rhizobacter sp.]|nr:TetR/AcrR family transcriptional regulator [Rhizobacter sp.]
MASTAHHRRPDRRPYRRTKAEQSELESEVVRVCLQLFADGGYEAISMRKLAGEVGMAPMSLYRYFPTKAHLMRHIWDDILHRACTRAQGDAAKSRKPHTRLRAFVSGFLDYWLENRSHYWVVFAMRESLSELHADASSDVLRPNPAPVRAALGELLAGCAHPRGLPPDELDERVEMLFQRLLGFLLGVIGLASVPWPQVHRLKDRLLDSIDAHVSAEVAHQQAASTG